MGVAGMVFSAVLPVFAAAQQSEPDTQPPAPIVRTTPRPAPRPHFTLPATPAGQPTPPGTVPVRRPRTQVTTPDGPPPPPRRTSTATPAGSLPQTTAPSAKVNPVTPKTPGIVTTVAKPVVTAHKPTVPAFSATGLNRNIIVLDPSHGGADSGARIGDNTLEKNVTLAFAFRLRSLLVARGFTVVMTRDNDTAIQPNAPAPALSLDDRAGVANHARATACLLLHATGRGMGVHLYNSELAPTTAEAYLLPWLTAQSAWVLASQSLEGQMSAALERSHIQLVSSTASVRPVDSLTCPALVLELAPETEQPNSINDAAYQSRVAGAIAGALVVWERAVQPPVRLPAPAPKLKKREEPIAEPATEVQP